MLADYHVHSAYSMDGRQTVEEACRAAAAAGLDEICLTDHIDFGHPDPGVDGTPAMRARAEEIAAARERYPGLRVRCGLEIGDMAATRQQTRAFLSAWPLDFRLLSLHVIDGVDPYYDPSLGRPSYFAGKTRAQAYRRYAQLRLEQLRAWRPEEYDALAHFGYVCKFAPYPPQERPFLWEDAPEEVDAALRLLAQAGNALEINTSGWKQTREPIPSRGILRRFRELGGEFVTFGSDAHEARYVGYRLREARELARACGFRYALSCAERKKTPYVLED